MNTEASRHQGTKAPDQSPRSVLWLVAALPLFLPSCGFTCTASPTLGTDAKQSLRVQGFDIKCTKRF